MVMEEEEWDVPFFHLGNGRGGGTGYAFFPTGVVEDEEVVVEEEEHDMQNFL